MAKLKGAKPATLIRRGDIKHKYAASLIEYFIRDWECCRNEQNRETKCKCLQRLDDAFLSAIERYVDSTWKGLSFIEKLAVAKHQSPVESCGMTGKFYLPFENGSQFHPVCTNTFCRLLGCSKKEFPQMRRALTDRDWLSPDLMKQVQMLPSGIAERTPDGDGRPDALSLSKHNLSGSVRETKSNLHEVLEMLRSDDEDVQGDDLFE